MSEWYSKGITNIITIFGEKYFSLSQLFSFFLSDCKYWQYQAFPFQLHAFSEWLLSYNMHMRRRSLSLNQTHHFSETFTRKICGFSLSLYSVQGKIWKSFFILFLCTLSAELMKFTSLCPISMHLTSLVLCAELWCSKTRFKCTCLLKLETIRIFTHLWTMPPMLAPCFEARIMLSCLIGKQI